MRYLIPCLLTIVLAFGFVSELSAKRFGGGRSVGVQRSYGSLFSSKNVKPSSIQQNQGRRWGGFLGGLLIGGLLASLFMGNGLFSGLLSWIIVGSIVFMIFALLRRKRQPGFQTQQRNTVNQSQQNNQDSNFGYVKDYFNQYVGNNSSASYGAYQQSFDEEAFLREAKITFIRLQAAYDQKNKEDLRAFTAPEVFAEIEMQLQERGEAYNNTEVINLNAELLDVSKQADSVIASVRFTGSIKENGEVSGLEEIWHFRQFAGSNSWVVGGIQQEVIRP